jgi:peptide/nickel transport system ATP-binding protein
MNTPLIELENVVKRYALPRESLFRKPQETMALAGVSLSVTSGRSLGIVGESGSGKSTLARIAMALEPPTSGVARFEGQDVSRLPNAGLNKLRRDLQMVFQDPYGSLDPRRTVEWIVAEPLSRHTTTRAEKREAIVAALASVGLRPADAVKYPHEFSGGQRQRIAIARALITKPRLIVADEPVSALDVSVQAQVLNLLYDLHTLFDVTFLLISHDLAVVDHVCDLIAVMYRGLVVEEGTPKALFRSAAHPYTRALVAAMPKPIPGRRRDRAKNAGGLASHHFTGRGCPYAERCPFAEARCLAEAPALRPIEGDRRAACHFAERVAATPMVY